MFGFGNKGGPSERSPHIVMPRGVADEPSAEDQQVQDGEIPSARWATSHEVLSTLTYSPDGKNSQMVLGEIDGTLIGTRPDEDRHLLTVAGSRAGKSVSAIIPNLLEYRGSALVADPKAELANDTALRRANGLGQRVYVLDPFDKASEGVKKAGLLASFNPLGILSDSDSLVEDAELIADAIVIPSGGDTHWDESAKRFLQGVVLHVATFPRYHDKRNLCTVRDLLNFGCEVDPTSLTPDQMLGLLPVWENGPAPGGINGLLLEMMLNEEAHGVVRAAAIDLEAKPDKERDSVLSTVRRQTAFLDLPRMRAVLVEGTFFKTISDLSILKTAKGGATIYLCLPAGYMRICNRWLRLFVDLALKAMERHDSIKPPAPVLFCLDEFPVLGYMPQIETAAGQLAGFGVRLWPIVQDLTQLKALYKDRWETFVGNAAVVQFFGNSDLTTLKYMSELVGKVAISVKNRRQITSKGRGDGDTGISRSIQSFDLLPVHEARIFFDRDDAQARQLLLYQGMPPIVAGRIRWYQHSFFKEKVART
jgi:type IV secretion system protein VirD4